MNTDRLEQAQNVFDLNQLDSLRQASKGDSDTQQAALKKAAQQFEAIFTQMLLKSMRKANEAFEDKESPFNSSGVKFFQDMHDQQLASELSGNGSLGLADIIVEQLSPQKGAYMPAGIHRSTEFTGQMVAPLAQKQVSQPSAPTPADNYDAPAFANPQEFVDTLLGYAEQAAKKIGVNPAVMLAQAALETGWGKHIIARPDGQSSNNLFNIKSDASWQGDKAPKQTLEFEQGMPVKKHALFRAYDSIAESFDDFVNFLTSNPRYQGALQKAQDSHAFIDAIHQAGYATDPNYAEKIKGLLGRDEFKTMLKRALHQGVN